MSARADFAFLHPLRVRWNECDAQGIVFNANYFVYYDIAIWEWTRALGYPRYTDAPEFVTAHAECDYLGSAMFDDEIDIGMRAARLGGKSMDIAAAVFRGETLLNAGKLTYVHVRQGTKETAQLPEEFIARVRSFEKTAPLLGARA
ncbi:MAG: thioesterase family protein [Parvularculaceae bacterium]